MMPMGINFVVRVKDVFIRSIDILSKTHNSLGYKKELTTDSFNLVQTLIDPELERGEIESAAHLLVNVLPLRRVKERSLCLDSLLQLLLLLEAANLFGALVSRAQHARVESSLGLYASRNSLAIIIGSFSSSHLLHVVAVKLIVPCQG